MKFAWKFGGVVRKIHGFKIRTFKLWTTLFFQILAAGRYCDRMKLCLLIRAHIRTHSNTCRLLMFEGKKSDIKDLMVRFNQVTPGYVCFQLKPSKFDESSSQISWRLVDRDQRSTVFIVPLHLNSTINMEHPSPCS